MSLNERASTARSRSSTASRRVSSRPPAMASAARLTSASGRSARRLAHQPRAAPANVVTAAAPSREKPSDESVSSSSDRSTISK